MEERRQYFLNPGELVFSKKPIVIKTVLGSCVAVALFDKKTGAGGMCHYLLPEAEEGSESTKYGNIAVRYLIHKFREAGSRKEDLEATIIGGAFIIFDEREIFFIGDRNVETASRVLKDAGIRVKAYNTGGEHGKRVLFDLAQNKLLIQSLENIHIDDLYNPGA
jgi:chemotaxis protein CheD